MVYYNIYVVIRKNNACFFPFICVLGVTILFKWPKDFTSYEYIFMRVNYYNITNSHIHKRTYLILLVYYTNNDSIEKKNNYSRTLAASNDTFISFLRKVSRCQIFHTMKYQTVEFSANACYYYLFI